MADLLRRLMGKNPDDRPKTMKDVLKTLEAMRIFKTTPKRTEK